MRWRERLRPALPFLVAYAAVAASLAAVAGAVRVSDLLDDPLALGGVAEDFPWKGSLSQVGGMAMAAGGFATAATAAAVRSEAPAAARLLLGVGVTFVVLAVDDLLVLHDYLLPKLLGVEAGVVEVVLFGAYGIVAGGWALACRHELRRQDPVVLVLVAGLLATSAAIDLVLRPEKASVAAAAEDVAKLLAAGTAAAYGWRTVRRLVRRAPTQEFAGRG